MAYYRTCQDCGSNLDPGERCNCVNEPKQLHKAKSPYKKPRTARTVRNTLIYATRHSVRGSKA